MKMTQIFGHFFWVADGSCTGSLSLWVLSKGYFKATRGSTRCLTSKGFIFQMGEVSELLRKAMVINLSNC